MAMDLARRLLSHLSLQTGNAKPDFRSTAKLPRWVATVSTENPVNAGLKVRLAKLARMEVTENRASTVQLVFLANKVIEVRQVAMVSKVVQELPVHKVLRAQKVVLDREEMRERVSVVWKVSPVFSVSQVLPEELEIPEIKETQV